MTANPARLIVRDLIAAAVPNWNVYAAARTPDVLTKHTAVIWTSQLTRTEYAGGEYVNSTVELWLLAANQDSGNLEEVLDNMLTLVLDAIEHQASIAWSTAVRGSLDGAWHGWHLTLTVAHNITT